MVGAGLSGISTGYHLQDRCPDRSYVILEARAAMGGTWDLFRYPGIRSDSDMHTLGFSFRPWTAAKAIADGPAIRDYVNETAAAYGIDRHIRYNTRVLRADWSTEDARWTVEGTGPGGDPVAYSCNFLCMCSGYYDYARGHAPVFPGQKNFAGRIVHPQFWPEDMDHAGKRIVVIGSGATAVTLVPALAKTAAHVTMLQRSPSYVVSRPSRDRFADWLRAKLPAKTAYGLTRWRNVLIGMALYKLARARPVDVRARITKAVRAQLGPDYDVATHFNPRYDPWDQRICLVPDSDLFVAIRSGAATVVTDTVDRFTPGGIRTGTGTDIAADIIVTATGLDLQLLSGIVFRIDGVERDLARSLNYKGMMFSDVPNMASTFGYANASWTLKADLTALYVCRLLNVMRKRGMRQATPRNDDPSVREEPFLSFTSGYVQRAIDRMPRQGSRKPWRMNQNYALDLMALKYGSVDDAMVFSNPEPTRSRASA
ncbi:FAD-containing monooxygenase EthA [Sphingomonas sp. Leaf17]|nr:FAD-containing monooxygenase EthA [Sphingomonas sp. Leaf17]